MDVISRRQFLFALSGSLALASPYRLALASAEENSLKKRRYIVTVSVLKAGYVSEMMAHKRYDAYCRKAIEGGYPNIAYLFKAFSISEKIHADNYKKILTEFGLTVEAPMFDVEMSDTKANLSHAAKKEMEKIDKTYPDFLAKLEIESHDKAVVSCMYAWKSHKQHEEKISEIRKYSGFFFGSVAKKIEGLNLDFHICEVCGGTVDEPPIVPCEICNYPISHFK